jgi:hypothetical protein
MQEFIARNGLIAQDNSIITGSLTTTDYIQAGFSPLFNNTGSRLSSDGTVNLLFSTTGNNSSGLSIGRAADNGTSIILRRGRFNATAIGVEGSAGSNNNSGVTTFSYYNQASPGSGINDGAFIELMRLNPPGIGGATLDVSGSARLQGNTTITGSLNVTAGITGSLFGTAATASYVISSSYASTASYVANASSFPFTGSAIITGSLVITGSTISTGGFTGSLFGTAATASYIQALSGYTTASRTLTINGQSYDLTADRSWTVPLSGSVRTIQKFIATAGQTSFTINGGYVTGLVDVYINGVKLDNNGDFAATDGVTVSYPTGAMLNDIVEVYSYISAFTANNTLRVVTPFTATAAQTTFSASYTPGFIDVFYNGSKLAASEYTASNGVSITLGTAAQLNDIVEVTAYSYTVGAFTGIGGSGTANYHAKFTSGSTIGISSIYDSGSNVGINTINPIYTLDVSGSARFTNSATITGSLNVSGSNTLIGTKTITGSVFISGSKTVIGTNTITGSLNVSGSITSTGTLTAQTLVVQTITSSVLYSSGSNIFGNSLANTQQFTGSVGITGSLNVNGITSTQLKYFLKESNTNAWSIYTDGANGPFYIRDEYNSGSRLTIGITGAATFSGPTVTIGSATAATNVKLLLNGVASKAAGIEFQQSGTAQWYIGNGIASEDNNFELYNSNGTMAMKIIKSTNTINFIGSNEVMNISGTNATSAYTGYYYNTNTLVGYIGNGSSILSGAASSDFIFRSQASLVFATGGNSERLKINSTGAATFSSTGGSFSIDANGQFTSKQNLDVATAGGRFTGQSSRGTMGIIQIDQVATSADGGRITFSVSPSGSTTPAEAMRITSAGAILVNSSTVGGKLYVYNPSTDFQLNTIKAHDANASTTSDGITTVIAERNTTNNTFYAYGYYNNGASAWKFRVADSGNVTNTNTSYGGISDIKLKENIVDATPKLKDLLKVKVRNYNLIGDETKQIGVIAQELKEVFPSMIEVHNDKDKEGNDLGTTTKSVKYSIFIPMLIKAIQELKAENDTLKDTLQRNNII